VSTAVTKIPTPPPEKVRNKTQFQKSQVPTKTKRQSLPPPSTNRNRQILLFYKQTRNPQNTRSHSLENKEKTTELPLTFPRK